MKTKKCSRHPEVDAIHVDAANGAAPLCVPCVVSERAADPARRNSIRKLCEVEAPIAPGHHSTKVCYQVMAGVIPGHAMPEFSEEWWITGEEWAAMMSNPQFGPDSPDNLFTRYGDEARFYQERVTDPGVINWVRLEFIYF